MKKISKKTIGIIIGVVAAVIIIAVIAIMAFRIDIAEAQQIALNQAGGGEIVESEVSSEGLWNEYSYTVVNGDTWYQVDISGFGTVEELETGIGDTWKN